MFTLTTVGRRLYNCLFQSKMNRMPSQYTFTDYSPDWPAEFDREAERLKSLLGDEIVRVHHIGSTSVPRLAAKPTIDVLPLVRTISRVDDLAPLLEGAGYQAWG